MANLLADSNQPTTSLQPLVKEKSKSNYTKLSDNLDDEPDPNDVSLQPQSTQTPTADNHRKQKHNKILFGVAIITLTVAVVFFIILFTVILDLDSDETERKLLFISHPNSKIYTMDITVESSNNTIESFCVDITRNRFLFIGNKDEIYPKCKAEVPDSQDFDSSFIEIELDPNYSILPGLIDAHAHIMSYGEKYFQVDLREAASIDNLQYLIQEYITINNYNTSQWIVGYGWEENKWDDWDDGDYPTRWDLDGGINNTIKDYKLFLTRIDGTSAVVNTAAIMAVYNGDPDGLTKTEDPEGGIIVRDDFGNATGMLVNAMWLIRDSIPSPSIEVQNEILHRVLGECSENGLTGIHDAGNGPEYIDLYKNAIDNVPENVTLRINAFAEYSNDPLDYELFYLYKDLLTVRSVKQYMDNSLGPRGASLVEPYCGYPNERGVLSWNDVEEYYQNISKWHEHGFQICTHAIGDNGNRVVIDAYERLINEYDLDINHRLRIEHCQIVNRSIDIPRLSELHIIPSMQPAHCTSDMVFAIGYLNCTEYGNGERLTGAYAWQTMLDVGVDAMPFGSDFPASGVINPFVGIYAAVTRANQTGYPEEGYPMEYNKVSLYQTLKGYTIDAAYGAFQEDELGSITEGKYADFIIIDRDLFDLDSNNYIQILDTNVLRTYLGGNIVFDNLN